MTQTNKALIEVFARIRAEIDNIAQRNPGRPICYLSGPISAYPGRSVQENLAVFGVVFEKLCKDYVHVVNPASVGDLEDTGASWREILDEWLQILSHRSITHVAMLPEWKRSKGASEEHELALKLHKNVLYHL